VSGGRFSSTAIEIIEWGKKIAVAQAKVTHILRPWKASEKELFRQVCVKYRRTPQKKKGGKGNLTERERESERGRGK
jgi:hypothetical protein